MPAFIDITGNKYNRLTVISREFVTKKVTHWKCLCDCGNTKIISGGNIKGGYIKSCGCLHLEKVKKHGMYESSMYSTWENMVSRCNNPNNKKYKIYGAVGIKVCDRWLNFVNFYEDMGLKPEGLSIGRIDGTKGYYKENCRWETYMEQGNNTSRNVFLTLNGKAQTVAQWAIELGVNRETMRIRAHKIINSQKEKSEC